MGSNATGFIKSSWLWKGGSAMNSTITIDWKFIAALGASATAIIFTLKMDSEGVENVSTHIADACRDYAISSNKGC